MSGDLNATTSVTVELAGRRPTINDVRAALDVLTAEDIPETFEVDIVQREDREYIDGVPPCRTPRDAAVPHHCRAGGEVVMTAFLQAAHDLRYVIATALLIWAAAWVACKVIGWAAEDVARKAIDALADDAEWWSEPTRAQIEADMRDDREWGEILAAVGLTPEDVRRRWREAQTPIHDELAVERLRADLDAWGGDVA